MDDNKKLNGSVIKLAETFQEVIDKEGLFLAPPPPPPVKTSEVL